MWLDAIRSMDAELELLAFTPSRADTSPESAARTSRVLAAEWGVRAEVTLCPTALAVSRPRSPETYLAPIFFMRGHSEFGVFGGPRQEAALSAALARAPDVVFFHTLYGAAGHWKRPAGAKVFLDMPDIEHRRFLREITQPPRRALKPLQRLWVPSLWWGERSVITRSDQAFVCSETDREYLGRAMGVYNIRVIPNATAHVPDQAPSAEANVLFIGTYTYGPNRVAADYLVREVWPLLAKLRPEARLLIAGPRCEDVAGYDAPPAGVDYLGFVPDLDALYARTRVFCCPIQSGGGTRVKILEAANHGVPIVSTPIGAEGIELEPEREILLRRSAADIAGACAELLAAPVRAHALGTAGRERVRALYGREAIVERMRRLLAGVAA